VSSYCDEKIQLLSCYPVDSTSASIQFSSHLAGASIFRSLATYLVQVYSDLLPPSW
jgi:hypothetical protein